MRAVLRCDLQNSVKDWIGLLSLRIAGLSLLERHLLAFKHAGINQVVIRTASPQAGVEQLARRIAPEGLSVVDAGSGEEKAQLEVRADTLVDPRLIRSLVRLYSNEPAELTCTDVYPGNYHSDLKSPYRVGVDDADEPQEASEKDSPIGVVLRPPDAVESPQERLVAVGKSYWHRIAGSHDVREATRKVFLSAMKPTDGIYARTNRRISIPISRVLVRTSITPNIVTLIALCCSLAGAWMYSLGTYWTMVAGSLMSWFASMLDGCDGEVARVKFQASEFGAWLEMVCDYLYYVVMFLGMGIGIARYTGNPAWIWVGVASVLATVVSFVVIARLKKRHARQASSADFGRAFQAKVGERKSNPLHFFSRHTGFLVTRAFMPYFIVFCTVLNIATWCLGLVLLGTNLAWFLALCAYPLFDDSNTGEGQGEGQGTLS